MSDLPSLRIALRLAVNDFTQDALLGQLLPIASNVVNRWCKRGQYPLETTNYTGASALYPWQFGAPDLPIPARPIRPIMAQGTLTQGSPNITGLPSTGQQSTLNMTAGMPVCLMGQSAVALNNATAIPAWTTLNSVGTGSAVMSANAVVGGTFWLIFGLEVHLDYGGMYGQGVQPSQANPGFSAANSQLFIGSGYLLRMDDPQYAGSKSGLITRFGGGPAGAWGGWGGGYGGYGGFGMGYGNRGGLTASLPPVWERYPGSVRVDCAAGWGLGAVVGGNLPSGTALPAELTDACNKVVSLMRAITVVGAPVQNDVVSDAAFRMIAFDGGKDSQIGTIRSLLRGFRELSI